jgi:SEC-C motif-containing protein
MNIVNCPCGSELVYLNCCQPYHLSTQVAPTAEALMRSRYSAFVVQNADYLWNTTHVSKRKGFTKEGYLSSAKNTTWLKLEIVFADVDVVEFKAYYLNRKFQAEVLHEKSNFKQEEGKWFYVDGKFY